MDALAKLFKKLSSKEQVLLLGLYQNIKDPETRSSLDVKKLASGEFFRVRKGKFRVIFHMIGDEVIIDVTRLRSEKTYRDF